LGLTIVIQLINYFNASSTSNLALYPQIRKEQWSWSVLAASALTWIIYLGAYEFLLRGVVLFFSVSVLDQSTAIALNVCLYAIIHLPKGAKEALASIPFGIVLCLICLKSHSVWPAIFLHASLALSNEWFSLYYQPQMWVKWK
jgi:membrane protease YdiL (CAAX protease family)